MGKDAYYFSHDANAHTDPKILKLRMALGWEGYGIYWAIIENLRNQETYSICESEFMFLTLSLAVDEAKLKQMLSKCLEIKLLEISEGKVFSPSLLRRMEKADAIRDKRREAGAKGGKAKANAKAPLKQNSSKTLALKESKGKEKKVNKTKEEYELPVWVDKKTWADFEEMRKVKKKPMTDRARTTIINKLKGFGEAKADQILEQSITHCWDTVYDLKQDNNTPTTDQPEIFVI